jgi:hypothetical protein
MPREAWILFLDCQLSRYRQTFSEISKPLGSVHFTDPYRTTSTPINIGDCDETTDSEPEYLRGLHQGNS